MNNGTQNNKIVSSTNDSSIHIGKKLVDMKISEIMSLQKGTIDTGRKLFAVGRYQLIPSTLEFAVKAIELDKDTLFSGDCQDKLGIALIEKKRPKLGEYLNGKHDDINLAMLEMSKEWASIPNPNTGSSYYGSGNKSNHSVEEVKKVLVETRSRLTK